MVHRRHIVLELLLLLLSLFLVLLLTMETSVAWGIYM
jgi:hypothetical protein